jgi:hypothetical protein
MIILFELPWLLHASCRIVHQIGTFYFHFFPHSLFYHPIIPRCITAAVDRAVLHKLVGMNETVPCFMLLVRVFSPSRLEFIYGIRHVGFMVDEVALGSFFFFFEHFEFFIPNFVPVLFTRPRIPTNCV